MSIIKEIKDIKEKKVMKYIIILAIIFITIIYFIFFDKKTDTKINTISPEKRNIIESLNWDWKILYKKEYELNFPISWTLKYINKNEWEEVKVWEIIASLDDKYQLINLDRTKINLETAYANLAAKISSKWQNEI